MFISRQNAKGGVPLKGYPLDTDPKSGYMGYKIGYCGCGCNEPLFIRTVDLNDVVNRFGVTIEYHQTFVDRLRIKLFG